MSALIWCPFGDEPSAAAAASQLLDEGLVACANILPPMRSLYAWKGERGEGREVAVLFKTDASLLDRATERLAEIHPYDAPAVLGWRAERVGERSRVMSVGGIRSANSVTRIFSGALRTEAGSLTTRVSGWTRSRMCVVVM